LRWRNTIIFPPWILAGNGETESIFTLVQGLKPRQAMIVTPGFAEYRRALQTVDCAVREFLLREEDGWQLTDAILDALTPDLDCLFLCTRTILPACCLSAICWR
jgi:threonine-phosphate decarboxylase